MIGSTQRSESIDKNTLVKNQCRHEAVLHNCLDPGLNIVTVTAGAAQLVGQFWILMSLHCFCLLEILTAGKK